MFALSSRAFYEFFHGTGLDQDQFVIKMSENDLIYSLCITKCINDAASFAV